MKTLRKTMKTMAFLIGGFCFAANLRADSGVPAGAFPASRYQSLWTKSPFSISSVAYDPDTAEFQLIGLGKADDEFYASILEKQSGEIFVVSNLHPSRGFKLFKVHRGEKLEDSYAILGKEDETITLHLQPASSAPDISVTPMTAPSLDSSTEPKPLPPGALSPDSLVPHSLLPTQPQPGAP